MLIQFMLNKSHPEIKETICDYVDDFLTASKILTVNKFSGEHQGEIESGVTSLYSKYLITVFINTRYMDYGTCSAIKKMWQGLSDKISEDMLSLEYGDTISPICFDFRITD